VAYDNTNRWTLNKNADKQSDTHADYNGKINVDGKEYWLNGWIKDGPNGKFISGTIKAKDSQPQRQQANSKDRHSYSPGGKVTREDPISTGRPRNDDLDDSIPFAPEFR
jgi:hypothetical protein